MILVILGISVLLVVLGIMLYCLIDSEVLSLVVAGIGCVAIIMSFIIGGECIFDVAQSTVIDEKIAMYETENKSIESSISTIVENYQDYEKEIFDNSKPEDFIAIATQIYPELKSNDLVKNQMDIYVANNKKIKQLKTEKLDYKVSKWWLYFGK